MLQVFHIRLIVGAVLASSLTSPALCQGWRYLGPDSARGARQMDVAFRPNSPPRVAIARGNVSALLNSVWRTVLTGYSNPPAYEQMYQSVSFSHWNDSVAFVAVTGVYLFDPYVGGLRVSNIFVAPWSGYSFGGPVGGMPLFAYSVTRPGSVYMLMSPHLYRSSDNGVSWDVRGVSSFGYETIFLKTSQFVDSTLYIGWQDIDTFRVSVSTDDGSSWDVLLTIAEEFSSSDLLAISDTLILSTSRFATTSSCGIYTSTNHGASWTQVLSGVRTEALAIDANNISIAYAATHDGVYRSQDNGQSWQLYNNTLPTLSLVDIAKDPFSDTVYVATGDSGVFQVFEYAVDVREHPQLPAGFLLEQNFPNPFNPSTVIRYSLPVSSYVSLRVYDVLGREVSVLAEGQRGTGYHEAVFDAPYLGSGVYFCRMLARSLSVGATGEYSAVRKLVVVK